MEKIYTINNATITIKFGNIIDSNAEVIVSSDDSTLNMGGGISKAIREAAGWTIVTDAQKKAPAKIGDVVVTHAGNMRQKFIFHIITINKNWHHESFESTNNIDDIQQYIINHAIKKIFRLMAAMELKSIAFPAIGAGAAMIPYPKVSKCMAQAFAEALSITNKPYNIELYLYDRFGKMELWDFIPFFEAFAAVEQQNTEINKSIKYNIETDYSNVVIKQVNEESSKNAKIFICYSRKDQSEIKGICDLLNQMDIPYWIDIDGSYSGENFKEIIVETLEKVDLVLFISSEQSNKSNNVAKEINIADKLNKTIIPIRLDNYPYASRIEYDLIGIDYIDYIDRNPIALEKLRKSILGRLVMAQKF